MQRHDHHLPLAPDLTIPSRLDTGGRLSVNDGEPPQLPKDYSWLLEVEYRASSRWRLPAVTTRQGEARLFTQFLEPGQTGQRLLNLAGITSLDTLSLVSERCRLAPTARLLGFRKPHLDKGPILIIAPHPDDAELAAYGLYRQRHDNVWIVTLTAGERQKRLDRQYLPSLDDDTQSASRRKGRIRAWNSATTPLLAGVPAERLIMLGYFNDTLPQLLEAPSLDVPSRGDPTLNPGEFRQWNHYRLGSDPAPANRGEHLLEDLCELLAKIQPDTVVVTHPEIDPHPDHVAAAKATALALQGANHLPESLLLYANHLGGIRGFPRGPAHAAAGVWPLSITESKLGPWGIYSEELNREAQREKAVALDSMHDLRAQLGMEKRIKRWLKRRSSGLEKAAWKDYGHHDYYQTHIKAHETFAVVSGEDFIKGIGVSGKY
ncbi:PIG-L family deacetylase [Halomonas sp. CS7]|uniref:PIG-L family deacetylase n=1 Tax=Halomonas pelophila TaxID=3151122 RepID=A0ABV1N3E7_9GAMM